jgi:hypothetical protein
MAKTTPTPVTRGKWEATLRNMRAMTKKVTALERRLQALELERGRIAGLEYRLAKLDHQSVAGARRRR